MSNGIKISSVQNPLVKKVLLLKEKSRERRKTERFIVEGRRELQLARQGNYQIEQFLVCPEIMDDKEGWETYLPQTLITKTVYDKIAHRGSTEGILAIAKSKQHTLESVSLTNQNPLILVAEAPEKPGNIGALLRTADAASLDAVLIANPKSDIYNPNIIRSSVGCVFTTQIGTGSSDEIISFLKAQNTRMFCASLTASKNYLNLDYTGATAIVVGTESTGLSAQWLEHSDQNIIIPMEGEIDSMNVSVSAAILIFEAKRQRVK